MLSFSPNTLFCHSRAYGNPELIQEKTFLYIRKKVLARFLFICLIPHSMFSCSENTITLRPDIDITPESVIRHACITTRGFICFRTPEEHIKSFLQHEALVFQGQPLAKSPYAEELFDAYAARHNIKIKLHTLDDKELQRNGACISVCCGAGIGFLLAELSGDPHVGIGIGGGIGSWLFSSVVPVLELFAMKDPLKKKIKKD